MNAFANRLCAGLAAGLVMVTMQTDSEAQRPAQPGQPGQPGVRSRSTTYGNNYFNGAGGGMPVIPNYNYGYGGGYSPFGGYGSPYMMFGGDPYGGYLNGAASVIDSQGQYLINTQQAYQMAEQNKQTQLDTRRKIYDEWLYERSLQPSLNEQREQLQRTELRRSVNTAPPTEIWSGKALNDILTSLQGFQSKGFEGAVIPLSSDVLRHIHVTTGKGPGSSRAIKEGTSTNWPYALELITPEEKSTALRRKIDDELAQAKQQAAGGRASAILLRDLDQDIVAMRQMLVAQVSEFSPTDYIDAKRYLSQLDDAVKTLKSPDASKYVTGQYQAQGNNVRELVRHLTDNGLTFAPANAGDESSYTALHSAMVQYFNSVAPMLSQR